MKKIISLTLISLVATLSVPVMAAEERGSSMSGMNHGSMKTPMTSKTTADTQWVNGTVKKVDKAAGKVTLAHGPLTKLGMNMGMTMAFRVKDAAWLEQMKEGDKIRFLADEANGVYSVIQYEPSN